MRKIRQPKNIMDLLWATMIGNKFHSSSGDFSMIFLPDSGKLKKHELNPRFLVGIQNPNRNLFHTWPKSLACEVSRDHPGAWATKSFKTGGTKTARLGPYSGSPKNQAAKLMSMIRKKRHVHRQALQTRQILKFPPNSWACFRNISLWGLCNQKNLR